MKTLSEFTLKDYAEAHGRIIDDAIQYGLPMAKSKFRADMARRLTPLTIDLILSRADAVYADWLKSNGRAA